MASNEEDQNFVPGGVQDGRRFGEHKKSSSAPARLLGPSPNHHFESPTKARNYFDDDEPINLGLFFPPPVNRSEPAEKESSTSSRASPAQDQDDEYPSVFYPSDESAGFLTPEEVQAQLEAASNRLAKLLSHGKSKDRTPNMSIERPKLLFVDGTFAELAQAMADIVQVGDEVKPLLEKEQNEEALQVIVKASSHLNTIAEKDFNPSYNLLIHLVLESKDPKKYLPVLCSNLLKPIPSSPINHINLASNALTTIFNNLAPTNPLRYNVFMQICRFLKQNNHYEGLRPMLKNLPKWLKDWDTDEEDARKLYVEVAEIASEGGDGEESYHSLLQALATFDREDQEEITSQEAQQLSLRALRMALLSTNIFLFQDLRALPTVQALSDSHPIYAQLLDIFTEQDLEDYSDFKEEHEGFIEKEKLDDAKLERKMRLLTFASLAAASTQSREIPYGAIAKALQIPLAQVEMWSIDVIRAGLVEGRLSQKDKVFKVHRTTYRVFGEKQWRELGTRVDQYKTVVDNLLAVVRRQQAEAAAAREREQAEIERRLANVGLDGEGAGPSGGRGYQGERGNRGGRGGGRGGRGGFGGKEPRDSAAAARPERDDNDD